MSNPFRQFSSNPLFLEGGPEGDSSSEGNLSGRSSILGDSDDLGQPQNRIGWWNQQPSSTSSYRRRLMSTPRFQRRSDGRQTINAPSTNEVSVQASPEADDKETQTEAYVVMDASVSTDQFDENGNLDDTDVVQLIAAANVKHEQACSDTESTSPPRSPIIGTVYSQNGLPPINPCLKGDCPFADQLGDDDNPVWLGCDCTDVETGLVCNYWVHARCHGFPYMTQSLVTMAGGFRCPRHLE